MDPLISVIIPTYNGEKVIERAIKSILIQSGNFEILVCDDRSTDNTRNIAKECGAKIIMNKEHTGGPNAGRNNGIKNAKGKYIAFLDQDDEWKPGKIKKQMEKIQEGYEFVYSSRTLA